MVAVLEQTFRDEWGRVLAALIGFLGDFDLAEEAAQEAFAIAAERWPRDGRPDNPRAWLVTTARNRAIDRVRRQQTLAAKAPLLAAQEAVEDTMDIPTDRDERLELVFTCCHPALSTEAQVALSNFDWHRGPSFLFVSPERAETDGYLEFLLRKHRLRVTLLAVDGQGRGKSAYVAIFSQPGQTLEPIFPEHVGQAVERSLGTHFHYALARDLQQLEPATAVVVADGWQLYQQIAMAGGMIEGNIKPEPVRKVPREAFCKVLPEPGLRHDRLAALSERS